MKNPVGFIQTLGNKRKISKKTRPYDGLGSDCVSPNYLQNGQFSPLKLEVWSYSK
jgi:hypothetical protein